MKRIKAYIERAKENHAVYLLLKYGEKILHWAFGLPLLYAGVLMLFTHFMLHNSELWPTPVCTRPCNWLLVVAIILELLGAAGYFMKINRRFLKNLLLPVIIAIIALLLFVKLCC